MIEVKNLVKRYGDNLAVEDLSFKVEKGQIYGFLGPNGAGKTTTMNIITGCLAATSGEVLVDGCDIYRDAMKAKKLIGYLPEHPPLYLDMTPYEYLKFVGELKGLRKNRLKEEIEQVMAKVQITDVSNRLIKNLSKGYKQRVGLAQAILGDPEIIILDEPTVGLDPVQIVEIRAVIKSLAQNHTVIFSSHILSEVSALCSYILIISKGKLVAQDTTENLEKMFETTSVMDITVKGTNELVTNVLSDIEGIDSFNVSPDTDEGVVFVKLEYDGNNTSVSETVSFALLENKCLILKMDTEKASLEDVFMELVSSEESESVDDDEMTIELGNTPEMDAQQLLDGTAPSVWDDHMPTDHADDADDDSADSSDDADDSADNDETGEDDS